MIRTQKIKGMRAYRYKAMMALGRPLKPTEPVHHFTEEQLVICPSQKYHMLLHRRSEALAACGNASHRLCYMCRDWDSVENMTEVLQKSRNAEFYYHKACAMKNYKEKKEIINPRRNIVRQNQRAPSATLLLLELQGTLIEADAILEELRSE